MDNSNELRKRRKMNDSISIKETDELKHEISELKKNLHWQNLITQITTFIGTTLSTSVRFYGQTISGKQSAVKPVKLDSLLSSYGIQLLEPLSAQYWNTLRNIVTTIQNDLDSERVDMHPVVLEVIRATLEQTLACDPEAKPPSSSSSSSSSLLTSKVAQSSPYILQYEPLKVDEEKIAKIPDIAIVATNCQSKSIGSTVLPVEIKKKDEIVDAIHQSLGYLMVKLRDRLEIAEDVPSHIFGFCLGTDGYRIVLGCIDIKQCELTIQMTNVETTPFWPGPNKPETETLGVRLVRTLLSCTEAQLGHTLQNAMLVGRRGRPEVTVSFQLHSIVGRGGFATVFEVSISGQIIAIKRATRTVADKDRLHIMQIEHMTKELQMLTLLQSCNSLNASVKSFPSDSTTPDDAPPLTTPAGHFPRIVFDDWVCNESQPYLPLLPLGVPLAMFASGQSKASRRKIASVLRRHLDESLKAAHHLGYCHCDLRPDNVIYSQASDEFIIIDWGLGREIGAACHSYFGGISFFHDTVVAHYIDSLCQQSGEAPTLAYQAEFDLASAAYVEYAFVSGMKNLSVPWHDCFPLGELIQNRNECMTVYHHEKDGL